MNTRNTIFTLILIILNAATLAGQDILVTKISEDAGIHTDRRPISVGFYDSTVNKTFISWMGSYSDAVVKEFDHSTQEWSDDKIVGASPFADSHNYPGMIQTEDGNNVEIASRDVFIGSILDVTNIDEYELQSPSDYALFQNYPNPFNPVTAIGYRPSAMLI